MDQYGDALNRFLNRMDPDPRVGAVHVSLYLALLRQWVENDFNDPVIIERERIMQLAKISSPRTYFKSIKNLDEFGYISYCPAHHRYMKSSVKINLNLLQ